MLEKNRRGNDHKLRVLRVRDILERESSEAHPIKVNQILDELGLPRTKANQRNVREDIAVLEEYGLNIRMAGGKKGGRYYVGSRTFKPGEVKTLIDIVQSSHSIDERTSQNLVRSLMALDPTVGDSAQEASIRVGARPKTPNDQVFHNIEVIQGAMAKGHTVSFRYYDMGYDLRQHERRASDEDDGRREETPVVLTYVNDCYYLLTRGRRGITTRRLDRMRDVMDLGNKAEGSGASEDFDLDSFARTQFGMFVGEPEWVTLRINQTFALNALFDHYGNSPDLVVTPPRDGKPGKARIRAVDSPQFRGWVMGLNDGVTIIEGSLQLMDFAQALEKNAASLRYGDRKEK